MKILVTYATSRGSTKSIAERIQQRLALANVGDVTIEDVEKKPVIADFDVVIIGSAIHAGSWLNTNKCFIKSNSKSLHLHAKPTWAFSVGMPPDSALKAEETKIEEWLRKSIPLQGHKLFLGMWEEKGMGCYFKMLFLHCFGGKFEDRRDWQAIDAWADGIVNELRVDQQVSGPLGN